MAKWQVDDFNRYAQNNNQRLLEEQKALSNPTANAAISNARALIESTMQTQDLGVHYLSVIHNELYNAFLCKLPQINPSRARYKVFVRESYEYIQKKLVYDESFDEVPEIDLYDNELYIHDRAANEIKRVIFHYKYDYISTGKQLISIKLPEEIQLKKDPSNRESNRQLLAQSIHQKLGHGTQMMADSNQKIADHIKEVQ